MRCTVVVVNKHKVYLILYSTPHISEATESHLKEDVKESSLTSCSGRTLCQSAYSNLSNSVKSQAIRQIRIVTQDHGFSQSGNQPPIHISLRYVGISLTSCLGRVFILTRASFLQRGSHTSNPSGTVDGHFFQGACLSISGGWQSFVDCRARTLCQS